MVSQFLFYIPPKLACGTLRLLLIAVAKPCTTMRRHWADNLDRKLNQSSSKVEDPSVLKTPLTDPKVKKITLHFPLGLEVVARNMKGVTIKDALDAIHKQFKKRVSLPC